MQRLLDPLIFLCSNILEFTSWVAITIGHWSMIYAVTELFSDKDWERLLGESGFKAALIVGIVTVWATNIKFQREHRREVRQALEDKDRIIEEKDLKCSEMSERIIRVAEHVAHAVETFDRNSQLLHGKIDDIAKEIKKS